jgi:hypothetical protein
MNHFISRMFGLAALLVASCILAACGGEEGHEEEESFENYAECYEHLSVERGTTNAAMQECDEMFSVMHSDIDGCRMYYADITTVPMDAVEAWCTNLFP